jgi:hypothetical protein
MITNPPPDALRLCTDMMIIAHRRLLLIVWFVQAHQWWSSIGSYCIGGGSGSGSSGSGSGSGP